MRRRERLAGESTSPGGDRHLTAWWETELHSEAEQAALRYPEALTSAADTDQDAAFQRFHDALAENFSQEEILEIVGVVVNMNVWTRITDRCRTLRTGSRLQLLEVVQATPIHSQPEPVKGSLPTNSRRQD